MSRSLEEGKAMMQHFNVGVYESLSEETEDSVEQEYLNATIAPKEPNVFTWWNIALTTGFVGMTLMAVSYLPYQLKGKVVEMASDKDSVAAGPVNAKPNFIFVLADDVAWNSMGYMGYDIKTTNYMDSLAKSGVILTNYYAQEVCTPSRASLMTGRYPISLGMQYGEIMPAEDMGLHLSETLLTDVLHENGYKTYGLGKWNLGHFSPQYLPTARGFDSYLGYMDGYNHYWSKRDPYFDDDSEHYHDFMIMDQNCYGLYEGEDRETYSTTFYMNKAVDLINSHDFVKDPLFLYLPVTAAHDPFSDYDDTYPDGITADDVGTERYEEVMADVVGSKRQQYALSLALLDDAVQGIHTALKKVGQDKNTFIIFASDNGGCYMSGGRGAPLRGTKGTLWEGGTRVNSFIYSPLLSRVAGTEYSNLFHVSDWFPTILALANIEYESPADKPLDGYDHSKALMQVSDEVPREYMIYNMWANVSHNTFDDLSSNIVFAVRNSQYKLIHTYSLVHSDWYEYTEEEGGDDDISSTVSCGQSTNIKGTYKKFLFDLTQDPYEETNLYDSDDVKSVINELFGIVSAKSTVCETWTMSNAWAAVKFSEGGYIQPWDFNITEEFGSYPNKCMAQGVFQYEN